MPNEVKKTERGRQEVCEHNPVRQVVRQHARRQQDVKLQDEKTRGCIIAWKQSFQRLHLGNMFIFQLIFIPSWNLEVIQIKIYQSRLQTVLIVHFSSLI